MSQEAAHLIGAVSDILTPLLVLALVIRVAWESGDTRQGWRGWLTRRVGIKEAHVLVDDGAHHTCPGPEMKEWMAGIDQRMVAAETAVSAKIEECQNCLTLAAQKGGDRAATAAQILVAQEGRRMKEALAHFEGEIAKVNARLNAMGESLDNVTKAWLALRGSGSNRVGGGPEED